MKSKQSGSKRNGGREGGLPVSSQFDLSPRPGEPRTTRALTTRTQRKPAATAAPETPPGLQPVTTVEARIDVGFGNTLFIRGEGDGLSWETGRPLTCIEASRWAWRSDRARGRVVFKLLLNDTNWAQGPDQIVNRGESVGLIPSFA
jgi:hypothetical protein